MNNPRPAPATTGIFLLWVSVACSILILPFGIVHMLRYQESGPLEEYLLTQVVGLAILVWLTFKVGRGRNWARITFVAIFFLGLPSYLTGEQKTLNAILVEVFTLAVEVVALGLLFLPASSAWFNPKLEFNCPECGKSVTFRKSKEGASVLCPECNEIIRVPGGKEPERIAPEADSGLVCLDSFALEMPAMNLKRVLEANGIAVEMRGATESGVLGGIAAPSGFRVLIDAADWERAVAASAEDDSSE